MNLHSRPITYIRNHSVASFVGLRRLAGICLLAVLVSSCGVNKFIPQGEYLLNSNEYVIEKDSLSDEQYKVVSSALSVMDNYAQQQPNTRILGVRLGMRIYCLSNPQKDNWVNRTIRDQGAKPVIFDRLGMIGTAEQLKLLLESKGCFNSEVFYETDTVKENRINVTYRILPTPRYVIDTLFYVSDNADVQQLIETNKNSSLIKQGDYYDQDLFSKERSRLATYLQNSGYYTATIDVISFLLDTNEAKHTMSVEVRISNPKIYVDQQTVEQPLTKYYIDNVYIYPDLQTLLPVDSYKKMDTLKYVYNYRGRETLYHFVVNKKMQVDESVISRAIFLAPGNLYRLLGVELTYNSLISLRNFKFTDVDFVRSDRKSDTAGFLNARIRLMNAMKHSVSTSVEITNTSPLYTINDPVTNNTGNFGLQWTLGYQNRNLFGGAELFNVKTTLLFELAKSALNTKSENFYSIFSAFETGVDLSLDIPKFIVPVPSSWFSKRFRPSTEFALGINYQFRTYFERALANVSFGYNWRNTRYRQHQLVPFEFTYVRFLNQSQEFKQQIESLSDLRLKYQYTNHLIMNTHYTFVYNTQRFNTKTDFTYFSLNLETAGNLLYSFDKAFDMPADSAGVYQLLGVPYSQYLRTEMDWKRYFYLSDHNTFVVRTMLGIGIPYGNSVSLPYEKSFYGGGPTTIRAWNIRTLGPGAYFNDAANIFERVGDLSLVVNIEDRFHLFGMFEGAVFLDMGNIWLLRPSSEFPDGNFNFKTFIPQIAMGGGLGLRMNISIITLRLDFAIPFYDPQYSPSQRWRFPHWKWNQIVTNFGIDYPF